MINYSFFVLLVLILTSCQFKKEPAPIIYNHRNSGLLGSSSATIPTLGDDEEIISTEVIKEKQSEVINPMHYNNYVIPDPSPVIQNYKVIYHEVQVGETIEKIALKYKQTVDEIAELNSIFPPYYLDEFQTIKIKVQKNSIKNTKPKPEKNILNTNGSNFIKPIDGMVLVKFGEKTPYGINKGINIAAKEGTKIVSSTNGKVIYADYDAIFGYLIIIKVDGQNIFTSYAHMEDLIITKGKTVKQGDIIGYVGNTGKVDRSQLNFAIREGKSAKDPMKFIKF